ncbi:MAG: hypothetical protein K6F37_07895 [Lachnospiraceae bacterium]|nr:hypothetical protein [Lachnospiraceae bacterium]
MKKFWRALVTVCLTALIVTGVVPEPAAFAIASLQGQNPYVTISESDTVYAASTKTITVKKSDSATAKKIHKAIKDGKPLTLKVKGNSKKSEKLVVKLQEKIKKVNGQGVIFQYRKKNENGKYTIYEISKDNAKLYMYAVKFVDKLYKSERESITKAMSPEVLAAYQSDVALYPDDETRKLHIYYEYLMKYIEKNCYSIYCNHTHDSWLWGVDVYVKGLEPYTISITDYVGGSMLNSCAKFYNDYAAAIKETGTDSNGDKYLVLKTYSEFFADSNNKNTALNSGLFKWYYSGDHGASSGKSYAEGYLGVYESSALMKVVNAPKFSDLSDAMKIWAIGESSYFDCHFDKNGYWMEYDSCKRNYSDGSKGMKNLYTNKAYGVCATFACYEVLLFKQLGITAYYNSAWELNHAWSVVKVKNSVGKTMWIPFDYGVGPSSIGDRLNTSENGVYKVYLAGIKGAPKKKNFKDSDFN